MKLLGELKDSEINHNNIDLNTIQQIARSLLLEHTLVIPTANGPHEFKLGEIEFYINSPSHNDSYTHGDKNQKEYCKWYFHRYKTGAYKSGTYKGLDFTLGNKDTHFGILIRSIYDPLNSAFIEGPCKIVNKILELNNSTDVKTYMADKQDPLCAITSTNLHLKSTPSIQEDIYTGPRIGLSQKYPEWQNVNYRFLVKKNLIKKGKKTLIKL